MFMMTLQTLTFKGSWKRKISKYLENKRQFFPLVKKLINCTLRAILFQKIVFIVGNL